jgi:hypothetical protein
LLPVFGASIAAEKRAAHAFAFGESTPEKLNKHQSIVTFLVSPH